jgi:predicted ArsR family transcriptional regulator
VVFIYQNRGKKVLLAADLAKVADVPEETAKRHLPWLVATGLLRPAEQPAPLGVHLRAQRRCRSTTADRHLSPRRC